MKSADSQSHESERKANVIAAVLTGVILVITTAWLVILLF